MVADENFSFRLNSDPDLEKTFPGLSKVMTTTKQKLDKNALET